ncbi:unnamed protein product [Paramecium primaurelia]|uniref:Uncharacterized protein n=2 Tax=Paramecium TaxID=5884 RepID=A0A8S1YAN8_9CILI|nr:unnamed protein product [Paramecium primaurelia]CAD8210849.1 unnamed protein product [Paramecium pentaurelia]
MSKKTTFHQIISVIGDLHHHTLLSPLNQGSAKRLKRVTFETEALYLEFRSTDSPIKVNSTLQKHLSQRSISVITQP